MPAPIAVVRVNRLSDNSKTYDVMIFDGSRQVCTLPCMTEGVAYDLTNRINTSVDGVTEYEDHARETAQREALELDRQIEADETACLTGPTVA